MPRPIKRVKSFGAVDLHFHGAFGVDLMTAEADGLNYLSEELWKKGVAAFSATTLSASAKDLQSTVRRLGAWIRSDSAPGARPLGIHLEGPFLNRDAAGAHSPGILRPLTLVELEKLWDASKQTLQILTLAPETLTPALQIQLARWAEERKIRLSIGHTRCTEAQAKSAFDAGFSGVTHAWNALSYHHREPGVLGAAFGRKEIAVELILDEVHVASSFISWTLALHPDGTFFVSDAAPAACTSGKHFHAFGDLECKLKNGACRLANGVLAGGGFLLPTAFADWVSRESKRKSVSEEQLLKEHLHRLNELPLKAVFFTPKERKALLQKYPVLWEISPKGVLTVSKRG